jgi:hypothetical protein
MMITTFSVDSIMLLKTYKYLHVQKWIPCTIEPTMAHFKYQAIYFDDCISI